MASGATPGNRVPQVRHREPSAFALPTIVSADALDRREHARQRDADEGRQEDRFADDALHLLLVALGVRGGDASSAVIVGTNGEPERRREHLVGGHWPAVASASPIRPTQRGDRLLREAREVEPSPAPRAPRSSCRCAAAGRLDRQDGDPTSVASCPQHCTARVVHQPSTAATPSARRRRAPPRWRRVGEVVDRRPRALAGKLNATRRRATVEDAFSTRTPPHKSRPSDRRGTSSYLQRALLSERCWRCCTRFRHCSLHTTPPTTSFAHGAPSGLIADAMGEGEDCGGKGGRGQKLAARGQVRRRRRLIVDPNKMLRRRRSSRRTRRPRRRDLRRGSTDEDYLFGRKQKLRKPSRRSSTRSASFSSRSSSARRSSRRRPVGDRRRRARHPPCEASAQVERRGR